jgi:hypothetical protein
VWVTKEKAGHPCKGDPAKETFMSASLLTRICPVVYGKELAYELRNRTAAQRAALAASYDRYPHSKITVVSLTDRQWAGLFRISIPSLVAARTLSATERELVFFARRPLIEPQDRLKSAIRKVGTEATFDLLCTL